MKKQEILTRLITDYKTLDTIHLSTIEGSFAFDTLSANATEFAKAYAEIDLIKDIAFVQHSWGEYLTNKAEEYGIIRKKATKAKVLLTVTGTAGSAVPSHSVFSTLDGKTFYTVEPVTIGTDGRIDVKAEAKDTGSIYNVLSNTITHIPMTIYGVSSVINPSSAYDGFIEETDEELRARVLFKMRMPATSGNVYHYEKWVMSVEGVGGVKIIPLWQGPGTVKVVVIDREHKKASEDLLERVREKLQVEAPIGATVTVVSAIPKLINIHLTVSVGKGNIEEIKDVLSEYFKGTALVTNDISYAQIGRIILDNAERTGVRDYKNLRVNDNVENIPIEAYEIATVGEVILDA